MKKDEGGICALCGEEKLYLVQHDFCVSCDHAVRDSDASAIVLAVSKRIARLEARVEKIEHKLRHVPE